ncbi:hypothetical protein TNCV_1664861 [Trichonephila clavipes]|uniref:Uncharacterized protein n=1 Tax=Trichonephila clavipes TaxID=2585209 RepID=A0A8X6RZY9_TRICX|nr:hypothetical protein TNCV_1664861 [Trichonephila clavipes]
MFDGLVACAVIDGATTAVREGCGSFAWPGSPMKEGRFVLGTFRSERMRVLYRSRQNDRLRVMLVLVLIDITPPQQFIYRFLGQNRYSLAPTNQQFPELL